MATKTMSESSSNGYVRVVTLGAIGGIVGGMVFGMMMAMMDSLPMVGMLIGQQNAVVGFIVHMAISVFIGATFGLIATRLPKNWSGMVIGGGVYGIVWWVLGALVMMPLMLGMNNMVLQIDQPQIMSLMGHVIFGVIMGAVVKLASERM